MFYNERNLLCQEYVKLSVSKCVDLVFHTAWFVICDSQCNINIIIIIVVVALVLMGTGFYTC
jgi:hypothetical protein